MSNAVGYLALLHLRKREMENKRFSERTICDWMRISNTLPGYKIKSVQQMTERNTGTHAIVILRSHPFEPTL